MLALPLPHILPSNEPAHRHASFAFAPDMSRPLLDPSTPSPSPVDPSSRSAITHSQPFLHQDQHQNQHQLQNHSDSLPNLPADKYHHSDYPVRRMSEPAPLSPLYYASPQSSSSSSATMNNNSFAFSSGDVAESSTAPSSRPLFAPSLHPRASTGSLRDARLQHLAHQQQPTNNISHTRTQYRDTYANYLDDEQPLSPTDTFAHNLPPPHPHAPHAHAPPPSSSGSSVGGTMHHQHGLYQSGCSSTGGYAPYSPLDDNLYGPSPPGTGTSTSSSLAGGAYGSLGSGLSGSSLGGPPLTPGSPERIIAPHLRRGLHDGGAAAHEAYDSGANGSPSDADRRTYAFVALPGNTVKKRPRRRYDEIERMYMCIWPDCGKAYGTLNHLNAHVSMQRHGKKRNPAEFKELRKQWRKAKKEQQEAAALAQLALGPHGHAMHHGHHSHAHGHGHTLARRDSFPGAFGTQHGAYLDEDDEDLYHRPSHSSHGYGSHSSHSQRQLDGFDIDLEFDYAGHHQQTQFSNVHSQQPSQQQHMYGQNTNASSFGSSRMFQQRQSHLPPSMVGAWNTSQQQQQQNPHHSQLPHLEVPPNQHQHQSQHLHHHQSQYQHNPALDLDITGIADVDANGNPAYHHHDGVNASPFGFNAGAGGITVPASHYASQSHSPAGSRPGTGAGTGLGHGQGMHGMHLTVEGAMAHGLRRSLSASVEEQELHLQHGQQHSQDTYVAQS